MYEDQDLNGVPYQPPSEQPSQSPYQQPYQAPDQNYNQPPTLGHTPAPKKKPPIIAIVLALVLICGGVYYAATSGIFGDGGSDKTATATKAPNKSPKTATADEYITTAVKRTAANIAETPKTLPDVKKILAGGAFEHDITIGIDSVDSDIMDYETASYFEMLIGSNVNLNTQTDIKAKKFLLSTSVSSSMINLDGYKLFISENLIGALLPDFYAEKYISINPKTFVNDYNESWFGEDYPITEEDVNLPEIIKTLFGSMKIDADATVDLEKFSADFKALTDAQVEKMIIKDEGEDSKGNRQISYTMTSENAMEYIKQSLELCVDVAGEALDSYAASTPDTFTTEDIVGAKAEMDMMVSEMLDSFDVPDDIVIVCTTNDDQLVTRVKSNTFTLAFMDEYSDEPTEVNVSFDIAFNGKKNLTDDLSVEIVMEANGEEIVMNFNEVIQNDKDSIGRKISFGLESEDASFSASWDYLWNSKEQKEDNFSATLEMNVYDGYDDQTMGIKLSGKLSEKPGTEMVFKDGILDFYNQDGSALKLNVDYSVKKLKEVAGPTIADSTSLFTFSEEDLQNMVMEGVMKLQGQGTE